MATDVIMPNLGLTMDEGTVARWLVGEGQRVARGQPLLEVETDKVTVEVEAPGSGIMGAQVVAEGQRVSVGTVLARIYQAEEPGRGLPAEVAVAPARQARGADRPGGGAVVGANRPAGGGGRPAGKRVFSSPRARTRARQQELDWRTVVGSGPRGRVVERDVLAAARARKSVVGVGPAGPTFLTAEADLRALLEAQRRLQEAVARRGEPGLSMADWLLAVVAIALRRQEVTGTEMGLAVLGPKGTVVPVAGAMQACGLTEVAGQRRRAVEGRDQQGPEAPPGGWVIVHDLSGSVARVYGGAPPWPRSALLTLGRVQPDQQRWPSVLSLSWDAGVWSLEVALGFLEEVVGMLEEPFALL